VKLQRQLNRRLGDREYAKWVIVLPPKIIRQLGWKEGQEFMFQIDGKTLRLKPSWRSGPGPAVDRPRKT
jgi:hypothetical protein